MLTMILKMSAATLIYLLLSLLLWKYFKDKSHKIGYRILIGVIYGAAAVLSTHFGVDYNHMIVNIRDLAPLTAGLMFDPVSGIIAGLIGGIERYIAGTFWGIGSYTVIACSVSTILAGFLAAFVHKIALRSKRPNTFSALFIGAVMEVFHMYAVFFTHRDDMYNAFYVVRRCAIPMIVFSAIGLALFSFLTGILDKEKTFALKQDPRETPLATIINRILLVITTLILILNFAFSYVMQNNTALQSGNSVLYKAADAIRRNYTQITQAREDINQLAEEDALSAAQIIAAEVDEEAGAAAIDPAFLERVKEAFELISINITDSEGNPIVSVGGSHVYTSNFKEVLSGEKESEVDMISNSRAAVGTRCPGGMVQVVLSVDGYVEFMNYAGLNDVFTNFQVGNDGTFDIVRSIGVVIAGDHHDAVLSKEELNILKAQEDMTNFHASFFGVESLCRKEKLPDGTILLVTLPLTEVYLERDIQAYETGFAAILLFAVLYAALYMVVDRVVVQKMHKVNSSLKKITEGDLNQVIDVRTSREFNYFSDDINQTVDTLKGYITAAEQRMEQELVVARTIQESALPRVFKFPRDDFALYTLMKPAREVGGDFYDFFFISNNTLGLVIADVSGKGIPAALFMMRSRTMIQSHAREGLSPAELLHKSNNILCEGNDAEMFVTVWIGIIDLDSGIMKCANAGHEYPAILRAGGDYEIYKDHHGLVLGAMKNAKYTDYELEFHPGDKLFVYTDGIPEAINEEMQQYGTDRMLNILNAVKDKSQEEILPAVLEDIHSFVGDAEQFDDITMLGFEYHEKSETDKNIS